MIKEVDKTKDLDGSITDPFKPQPPRGYPREESCNASKTCPRCHQDESSTSLTFYWMGLQSGLWMCPNKSCMFPLDSPSLKNYLEEGLDDGLLQNGARKETGSCLTRKRKNEYQGSISGDSDQHSATKSSKSSTESQNSKVAMSSGTKKKREYMEVSPMWLTYPLWKNENSLCWLDATLTILLTNLTILNTVKKGKNKKSVLWNIAELYCRIQQTFQKTKCYDTVKDSLIGIRNVAVSFLKYQNLTDGSSCDSPVFALPMFLKDEFGSKGEFRVTYKVCSTCQACGHNRETSFERYIIPVPSSCEDFQFPSNIVHTSRCEMCSREHRKSRLEITRTPPVIILQFPNGVHDDVFKNSFPIDRRKTCGFVLTQLVQYTGSHFICWSRNLRENKWLRADDLGDPVVSYDIKQPYCKPEEVFLMVWEKLPVLKRALQVPKDEFGIKTESGKGMPLQASKVQRIVLEGATYESDRDTQQNSTAGNRRPLGSGRYQPYVPKRGRKLRIENSTSKNSEEGCTWSASATPAAKDSQLKTMLPVNFDNLPSQTNPAANNKCKSSRENSISSVDAAYNSFTIESVSKNDEVFSTGSASVSPVSIDTPSDMSAGHSSDRCRTRKASGVKSPYDSAYSSPHSLLDVSQDIADFLGLSDSSSLSLPKYAPSGSHTFQSNVDDNIIDLLGDLNNTNDLLIDNFQTRKNEASDFFESFVNMDSDIDINELL